MLNTHGAQRVVVTDPTGGDEGVNRELTLLTLTAASANTDGSDQTNLNAKGAVVVVDVTAISGTGPSLTVTVEGKVNGKYYTILDSAAITTVSTTVLKIHPGLTAAANSAANDVLPKTFRVRATIAGTGPSVTATVGASLI